MTTQAGAPPIRRSDARLWVSIAAAAILWWVLYSVNGPFWDWAVFKVAGFDHDSRLGSAIEFFVYDTTKVVLLLVGIILVVTRGAELHERGTYAGTRGRREGLGSVAAAGLRVATPFGVFVAIVGAGILTVEFLFNLLM